MEGTPGLQRKRLHDALGRGSGELGGILSSERSTLSTLLVAAFKNEVPVASPTAETSAP